MYSWQPELWNSERDVLTIWFDPGRIKRELIPNRALGNPLKSGEQYTILIKTDWKDARGLQLREAYRRSFFVTTRDSVSPDPKNWIIDVPLSRTNDPLIIRFPESLDYFLLKEVITVIDKNGSIVPGVLKITPGQQQITYHPGSDWMEGDYTIRIGTYLEDLAGNNINRLFEEDISKHPVAKNERFHDIRFRIMKRNGKTGNR